MEKETDFGHAIHRLLQEHPLYQYRIPEGKTYRLPVLLIGRGEDLDALRNKILSNGQLLDTELEVTVVTDNEFTALEALEKNAPDLKRFIQVQDNEAAVEMACGKLRFEQEDAIEQKLSAILEQYKDTRYVLISLDTDAAVPDTLSPAPNQMLAWVRRDKTDQDEKPKSEIHVCGPRPMVLRPKRDDESMAGLLDVAYRLHYAYEKGNDPYITNREIRQRFEESYNYLANIECALHVRSKIVSAGIDPSALNSAAEAFAKKMAEDARYGGDLLERLARLEHQRWCVSKAAAGRHCDGQTVSLIYGEDGSATHNIEGSDKWHVALVPYGKDGRLCRRLSEADWAAEDPEAIDDLDELDKQTLRVHWRCAVISQERLRKSLEHIAELRKEVSPDLHNHVDQMENAVKRMLEGRRNAVFAYRFHLRNLDAEKLDKDPAPRKHLKALKKEMGAPIEFLTRKDYKKQNLTIVGSIPFALCAERSTVLVKLMTERIHECVAAAWQLEPDRIVFVDTAETLEELRQLGRRARQIDRFLSKNCNQVRSSYHIFVPDHAECRHHSGQTLYLHDLKDIDPLLFGSDEWYLYPCSGLETEDLRPRFVDLMYEHGAASIDITGGKPSLISLAGGYARNNRAGAFFIRDNRIRNFCGARGMEWQALDKGLSVQQLFDQTGAELIKRDDDQISPVFFEQYEDLWVIAHAHAKQWYSFCLCFASAYRDKAGSLHPEEHLRVPRQKLEEYVTGSLGKTGKNPLTMDEFRNIMDKLQDRKLLTYDEENEVWQATCEEVIACLRNSGKILEYYIYCTISNHGEDFPSVALSWMFRHDDKVGAAKNEVDVICMNREDNPFFISAKNVSPDSLNKNNFLNYICYEVGWLADRFGGANPRTLLAAPNVEQFKDKKRSDTVEKAMKRGVYLLGDKCFEPGNLIRVLRSIDRGQEDWCEFMLGEQVPSGA